MNDPTLDDWRWVEIMLIQALIGAISDNIRQVALCYKNKTWCVDVVIAEENQEDREEVADVADQLGILLDDIVDRISNPAYANVTSEVHVSKSTLSFTQSQSQRLIFRRKETTRPN